MRESRPRARAGALVAVVAATLLLSLASLARVSPPAAAPHGCHCPVKMACCEAGLCHGEPDPEPSSRPVWSGCRDEAPHRAAVPPPPTTLDGALLARTVPDGRTPEAPLSGVEPRLSEPGGPAPAIPPPRLSVASR